MDAGRSTPAPRAPRADARRNRGLLVAAARAAMERDGDDASLDAIARAAGVGIGTLYRHFPTRESLVAEVYLDELDELCDAAERLTAERAPAEAMRAWMSRFALFIGSRRDTGESMRAMFQSGSMSLAAARQRVIAAVAGLLRNGAEAGSLRRDLDPEDVLLAMLGVFLALRLGPGTDLPRPRDSGEQVERLLDLLYEGIRTHDLPHA